MKSELAQAALAGALAYAHSLSGWGVFVVTMLIPAVYVFCMKNYAPEHQRQRWMGLLIDSRLRDRYHAALK